MTALSLVLFAALHAAPPARPLAPGDVTRSLEVGGLKRTYHVHVPPSYDGKRPVPVVLALHGAAMNGRLMKSVCGLDRKADEAGFVVVYPDGTGANATFLTWNSGGLRASRADDVAFLAALLDDLAGVARVDADRVYATGLSNGGMMAYRLAAELSDRVAAVAPVAGVLAVERCEPRRPVSVVHFHGTEDRLVPYTGGRGGRFGLRSVADSVAAFVKADGCGEKPVTTLVADGKRDGLRVVRKVYAGGKGGAEVVLYTVEGGGHTWPGVKMFVEFLGKSTMSVSANDVMWEFFQRHPRR